MEKNQNEVERVEEKKVEEEKPKPKPKEASKPPPAKQYYTVKIEATAPVTLEYRILAESPEQALEIAIKPSAMSSPLVSPPKPNLSRIKRIKANIYLSGTSLIKLTKNF